MCYGVIEFFKTVLLSHTCNKWKISPS